MTVNETPQVPPGGYANWHEPKNAELTLDSGTVIHLRELKQWETYESDRMFVLHPNTSVNDHIVELAAGEAGQETPKISRFRLFRNRSEGSSVSPYVIKPTETFLEGGPMGERSVLPAVTCIGHFTSRLTRTDAPVTNLSGEYALEEKSCSELTILWFQQEYAFPIAPEALAEICAIDWQRHATNKRIRF